MPIADPKRSFKGPKRRRWGQRGFTLIELVMVIVMLGILAIFAAPRMFNSGDFYARGFHDETLALLRYAQKTAIAQRRTVCVAFTTTTTTLTIAALAATSTCAANPLVGPKGESQALITARAGVTYSSTLTNFNFDGLGQPVNGSGAPVATQTIQVSSAAKSITVETATGYVHE